MKLLPSNDAPISTGNESLEVPQLKIPIAPIPKLPPQQALLPDENPFDIKFRINSLPRQGSGNYLKPQNWMILCYPPVIGDQITDSTLMHRYLPKQADIDRIME